METLKKKGLLGLCATAALGLLLAECTANEDINSAATYASYGTAQGNVPVVFDALAKQATQTRAGYPGEMDNNQLRGTGFGVFAYVSSASSYDFMYNQHVTYSNGWTYAPVKYWPQTNDNRFVASNPFVSSVNPEKIVTFYAYAPYVFSTSSSSVGTEGITKIPGRADTSGPKIHYKVPANPADGVDLLVGVAARQYSTSEFITNSSISVTSSGQSPLTLWKTVVGDKVEWKFLHTLTKFGITVDAVIDDVRQGSTGSGYLDPNTKILIEKVEFDSSTAHLATEGDLKLSVTNTDTPEWEVTTSSHSINDMIDRQIATNLRYSTSTSEFEEMPIGVTAYTQNLLGKDRSGGDENAFMFIPTSYNSNSYDVTVTYWVVTRDANMTNKVSKVQNVVKHSGVQMSFAPGYKTILRLHIGLTSVKMDAMTTGWTDSMFNLDYPANGKLVKFETTTPITISSSGQISGSGTVYSTSGSNFTVNCQEITYSLDAAGQDKLPVYYTSSNYYIPANYTTSARDIYLSFAGLKESSNGHVSQSSFDGGISLTSSPSSVSVPASGGNLTLTTSSKVPADFNFNDWDLTANVSDTQIDGVSVDSYYLDSSRNLVLSIHFPANNTGSTRSINVTLTHRDGATISTSPAISQNGN